MNIYGLIVCLRKLPKDSDIPIAQFGKSNIGIAKTFIEKVLFLDTELNANDIWNTF